MEGCGGSHRVHVCVILCKMNRRVAPEGIIFLAQIIVLFFNSLCMLKQFKALQVPLTRCYASLEMWVCLFFVVFQRSTKCIQSLRQRQVECFPWATCSFPGIFLWHPWASEHLFKKQNKPCFSQNEALDVAVFSSCTLRGSSRMLPEPS